MISCVLVASDNPGEDISPSLESIVRDLHGAQLFDISLVADSDQIRAAVRSLPVTVVVSGHSTDVQSIVAGLDALPRGELSGVLVWPLIAGRRSTKFLIQFFHEFYKSRGRIIVPEGDGQPIIIDACLFDELRHAAPQSTLQTFLDNHSGDLRRVSVVSRD